MLLRLAILLVAGFAIGWFVAPLPPPEQSLVQARRPALVLPAWQPPVETQAAALLSTVATAPFWGLPAARSAAPAPPGPDLRWRVAGLFGVGAQRKLRVEFRDRARQPMTLKVGEKLPSGHVITRIDERTYCVEIEGASYTLGVERSE